MLKKTSTVAVESAAVMNGTCQPHSETRRGNVCWFSCETSSVFLVDYLSYTACQEEWVWPQTVGGQKCGFEEQLATVHFISFDFCLWLQIETGLHMSFHLFCFLSHITVAFVSFALAYLLAFTLTLDCCSAVMLPHFTSDSANYGHCARYKFCMFFVCYF